MTSWQRRARFAIGIFGLIVALAVLAGVRRRDAPAAAPALTRADPSAVVESTGGVITHSKGAKESFTIHYERQLTYAAGSVKLMGVRINVDQRAGRNFVVTGREGEIGANQSSVTLTGNVHLTASDGLSVTADRASYSEGEGIVRVPGPMKFSRGRMAGSGVGMTYDKMRDVLWLLDRAVVRIAPDPSGAGGLDVTAGAAGFARADKYLRFERRVRISRAGRTIEADAALAHLSDDEQRVTALELRGHSRIAGSTDTPGSLQTLAASDMNLAYAPDGEHLEHATLSGASTIQLHGGAGQPGSRIGGRVIDLRLAPDGTTVVSLTAREQVQTDFPAQAGVPARTVRSTGLDAAGDAGAGLTNAKFSDNVEYRELLPGNPPTQRVVRARALDTALQPGMSTVDDARFSGAVRLEDGAVRGSAARARYLVSRGTVGLTGIEGTTRPRVADERMTVEAQSIELALAGRKLTATHDVRSVLRPSSAGPASAGGKTAAAPRKPGLLKQDEPVNVTADALSYDEASARAVYTGNARLWQGQTTVNGDTLTLDDRKGDLTAIGSVRSTWVVEHASAQTGAMEKAATIAAAKELHYDDALRRATYTTDAHVNGPQGDVTADKVEMYLAADGQTLERAEAYERVTVRLDQRSATGARLTFFAADERYVMTGAPVRIIEECRETTGKTLTFFKSTDRIIVDGNEERRTQTKSGGKCPEPPFD